MSKTARTLRRYTRLGVCILVLLTLGACRKKAPATPEPTATPTLPPLDIPALTPQSATPAPDAEGLTPPAAAPPTLDFGDVRRSEVVTTTIQSGDTVYAVAVRYDLRPETVVWSNPDLAAAPWLIQPGQALTILPVDGVYHQVQPGETAADIAAQYGVDLGVLANPWNDLPPGGEPQAEQWLVIPGGEGPEVSWEPPPPPP